MDAMDILNGATFKRPTSLPQNQRVCSPDPSFTKKLKRMPHLFTRVLELPLHAETPVNMVESRDAFGFEVRLPGLHVGDVKVEVLEIVPGATKVLVRGLDNCLPLADISEVDFWRFRLPSTTIPKKSAATYDHETLRVTIPKVLVPCSDNLDIPKKGNGEVGVNDGSGADFEGETEEERIQREVLEDLESFGSPRRVRSSPRSGSSSPLPGPKTLSNAGFESAIQQEKLQQEVLEELECFGSPRRRSASCTQSLNFHGQERTRSHHDFFRSVGSWVGGFTVYVQ